LSDYRSNCPRKLYRPSTMLMTYTLQLQT
jgi:hypothetical protein